MLHRLDGESGIDVRDWGQIDTEPREVSELWLHLIDAVIPAFAAIAAAWITPYVGRALADRDDPSRSSAKTEPNETLPGLSMTKADGSTLTITMNDPLSRDEREALIRQFLAS